MFAIPFGRMCWKEYRAHRSLWLSCLLIAIAFQCVFTGLLSEGTSRSSFLSTVTILLPILYAVACGAVLFAGEREERTCEWLLILNAPPGPTLSAKLAFAVVSTITLQFIVAAISSALISAAPFTRELNRSFEIQNPPQWFLYQPFALIVLIWSMLGSLFSQRVLISIPAMLFWFVATAMWPLFLIEYVYWRIYEQQLNLVVSNGSLHSWTWMTLAVFVAGDLWLGWRWCQGKYVDGAILENISQSVQEWRKRHFQPTTVTIPQVLTRAEYEHAWRRIWQRLIWQERHRESQHLIWLASLCGLGFTLALGSKLENDSMTMLTLVVGFALPVGIGVLAFRADFRRQQPRFLLNRGLSPGSLWLTKQVVWLPRAFWICGAAFFVSMAFEWLLVEDKGRAFDDPLQRFYRTFSQRPDQVIWFILLSYSCGQLASLLFSRVVLSIAFGAVLNICCALWQSCTESLHLPQWWSLGLPFLFMNAFTFWQMRGWLLEDHSRARRWKIAFALTMGPALLLIVLAWHRVAEATIPIPIEVSQTQLWYESRRAQLQPAPPGNQSVLWKIAQWRPNNAQDDMGRIDEIVDLLKETVPASNASNRWQASALNFTNLAGLHTALRRQAKERIQANDLEKGFEYLLASLRLARCSAKSTPIGWWQAASVHQRLTLEFIVNLACHPEQTEISIDAMRRAVRHELNQFPATTESVVATFLYDHARLIEFPDAPLDDSRNRLFAATSNYDLAVTAICSVPWERERLRRLITEESQLAYVMARSMEMMPNSSNWRATIFNGESKSLSNAPLKPFHDIDEYPQSAAISLAKETTPGAWSTSSPQLRVAQCIYDRIAIDRATLIRLALAAYRKKHGRSADRLLELTAKIDGNLLIDPYSGRLFEYFPSFLISEGPERTHIQPINESAVQLTSSNPHLKPVLLQLEDVTSSTLDKETRRLPEEIRRLLIGTSPGRVFLVSGFNSADNEP